MFLSIQHGRHAVVIWICWIWVQAIELQFAPLVSSLITVNLLQALSLLTFCTRPEIWIKGSLRLVEKIILLLRFLLLLKFPSFYYLQYQERKLFPLDRVSDQVNLAFYIAPQMLLLASWQWMLWSKSRSPNVGSCSFLCSFQSRLDSAFTLLSDLAYSHYCAVL